MIRNRFFSVAFAFMGLTAAANATTFRFDTDPFAGTPVLTAPGRQIVGGELFINFSTAQDVFSFASSVFGVDASNPVHFVNATAGNLPVSGVNVVVLETFDNDNNTLTPFGASQAADLIADHITTHAPGFFVYFNQSLNIPRLVYSTDLASHDSDLKILARMINLFGQQGMNAMSGSTAANFDISPPATAAPEPSFSFTIAPLIAAFCFVALRRSRREGQGSAKRS